MDIRNNELPFDLESELGPIAKAEEQAPGTFYIVTTPEDDFPQEYYVVMDSSPLAAKVQAYGKSLNGLRLYDLSKSTSGWKVVEYQLIKHMIKSGSHDIPSEVFHDIAYHAAEYHPEYFGTYPVPLHTPRGYTLRYQTLENGIYWIETDQCKEVLAVCYPIWYAELSDMAQNIGKMTVLDQEEGIDKTLGYLFFDARDSCVAIFELLKFRKEWEDGLIDKPALMNAVWKYHPQYALVSNQQEQTGDNDILAKLLSEFGVELEPQLSKKHIICITPNAGIDFLQIS